MPAPAHVQAATLQQFLDAWKSWDAEKWISTFDDDYTQATMPIRMGLPARAREEVEQILPALTAVVKNYQLTVHKTVHDAHNNQAAVFVSSTGDLPWGPWKFECAAFVTFSENGDKIAKVEEMVDSAFMQDFGPKFGQYLQSHGGALAVAAEAVAAH